MLKENILNDLKYLISYPEGFSEERQYPLVIFLHGVGTRSDNTEKLRKNSAMERLQAHQAYGYILLAPLCSVGDWNEAMPNLIALVEQARSLPYVDSKRVYLTGNSMGGYGTWELAILRADWFAAIMPVCGGGCPGLAKRRLPDVPVRAFHGLRDTVVDPLESLEMVKALNRNGGYAELILFPHLEHNCWNTVYETDANYEWLLQFTTDRDKTQAEEMTGAYYG